MKYIDLHCDTLSRAYRHKVDDLGTWPYAMVDIKRLKQANCMGQFFAIFMPEDADESFDDDKYIIQLVDMLKNNVSKYREEISFSSSYETFNSNLEAGKISAFLTIEDGRSVNGDFDKIKKYYDLGVRLITLTWNSPNCFGYPNSFDKSVMSKGLTSFGKEAIEYMNHLGIIVDVSHLSDGGFYDVAEISKKPFMASHSNCRALSPHPRNLTDEMIKLLSSKGGIIGVNIVPSFLNEDVSCRDSRVEDMAMHILHMINVGGIECVAIGTDFDGTKGNFDIDEPTKLPLLFDSLRKKGIKEDALEKIAYKNSVRVIQDCLV